MSTFTTILSFPFWFVGIVCIFTGLFGTVRLNGRVAYGQTAFFAKSLVVGIGFLSAAVAYVLVII